MIEVKLQDIINAAPALERIGESKLPAKAAWRVSRLLSKLLTEHRAYMKIRLDKFKEHGETKDAGQTYTVPVEKMPTLNAELEALLAEKVKVDYDPIPLALFGDAPLAPADLVAVEKFVCEDQVTS